MPATALRSKPRVLKISSPEKKTPRLSRTNKPEHMELHGWQRELRRQYGEEIAGELDIRNLGREQVFSEFAVRSPDSGRTYRVAIRGMDQGLNFCSCPDFSVNTLGTCKHIEGVLHRLQSRFSKQLRAGFAPPYAEVYVRYGTQRRIMFLPGRDAPPTLGRLASRYFDRDGTFELRAVGGFDEFLKQAASIGHELRVYDDAAALVAEMRDDQIWSRFVTRKFDVKDDPAWRKLLKVPLYAYQREGAFFAARAGRAIIADEMGLGKTIQAIAAAEILAGQGRVERVLIVCPSTLKSQWQDEIRKFSARAALIVEGGTHQRKKQYQGSEGFFKIANYDVIHRDVDAIAAWSPDLVVLDEAQRIKNWQTRTARSIKRIESRYAIVLTGTPLENRIEELHSIVEFVDRFRLGPLFSFKAAHEVVEEDSTKVVGYRDLNRISRTLAPILIRRTKKEVLDQLPPRMDKNFFVPMTEEQWVPHGENQDIVVRLVAKWRRYRFLTEADQLRLRIALQRMRMSCDNTYLIDHETRHGTKVAELAKLLEEIFEDGETKVVIFSQWLRMNELVVEMLEERHWGHVHLHGGVPVHERKELTRALREDQQCRVFLSTDAGGVGLNLQTASTVVNMDLPWNPAVLEQRIGRVHRLGQKRPVRVVNFVAEGTIEHGMLSLLSFKRSMFAGVLDGAADKVSMGGGAMDRFMKTVEKASSSIPTVRSTPTEHNDEIQDSPAKQGASGEPKPANLEESLDVRVLGEMLQKGAAFLQSMGRTFSDLSHKPEGAGRSINGRVFVANTPDGRPELRIPLPNQQILTHWLGQLPGMIDALLSSVSASRRD